MPKQTEVRREIAYLRSIKPASLNYCKKHFLVVDEKFIKTFYPKQSELIMNMARGGFFGLHEIKKKKYYDRHQIEVFLQERGFSKN